MLLSFLDDSVFYNPCLDLELKDDDWLNWMEKGNLGRFTF